jgi:hypothetical protein
MKGPLSLRISGVDVGDTRGDSGVGGYFTEDRTTAQLTQYRVGDLVTCSTKSGIREALPSPYLFLADGRF